MFFITDINLNRFEDNNILIACAFFTSKIPFSMGPLEFSLLTLIPADPIETLDKKYDGLDSDIIILVHTVLLQMLKNYISSHYNQPHLGIPYQGQRVLLILILLETTFEATRRSHYTKVYMLSHT